MLAGIRRMQNGICASQKPSGSFHGWARVGVRVLGHLLGFLQHMQQSWIETVYFGVSTSPIDDLCQRKLAFLQVLSQFHSRGPAGRMRRGPLA